MTYRAPLKDIEFTLGDVIGTEALAGCPAYADYSLELAQSVLEETARFSEGVLDPLYQSGDREGARWTDGRVATPTGFREAYRQLVAGGWTQLRAAPEYGGQGLPSLLVTAVEEIWTSANISFRLCPLLTQGAIEAIAHRGTDAQKRLFLPPMVRGDWTGTMNLTEPQAGSDLALIRTRAVHHGDHYRVFGQKIFITYGEHDLAENIVHLVLARVEGAPAGVRGISLFIVPKFLVNADGSLGDRNDVRCTSIEHKLGIRGSPTCTMVFGQGEGAVGFLLGEENRGLEYMFVMMNAARLGVGVEGYALAERAYQRALEWARTRIQGKPPGPAAAGPLPIAYHPDVRRMLLTMRSQIEPMRALALYAAAQLDVGARHTDPARRAAARARGEFLIPIVKGWSTETGIELCSLGVQVHGGMGFVEETGAAQILRDARIGTIYEGTTGIQAADLIGRKLIRDQGAALAALLEDIRVELAHEAPAEARTVRAATTAAVEDLAATVAAILPRAAADARVAGAVSVPLLRLAGLTLAAWMHSRSATRAAERLASGDADTEFLRGKLQTARFFCECLLPHAQTFAAIVRSGAGSIVEADPALF